MSTTMTIATGTVYSNSIKDSTVVDFKEKMELGIKYGKNSETLLDRLQKDIRRNINRRQNEMNLQENYETPRKLQELKKRRFSRR
jgi:RNAse (barnase) inhibitor barstar